MNMLRSDKGSTAPTPEVTSRPSKEDLDNPITHSLNSQDAATAAAAQETNSEVTSELNPKTKRTGVTGVVQKVNPFKSISQAPSTVSKAPSSESPEQGTDATQVSKAPSSESLEQGRVSDSNQTPGMLKWVMQKVNPFKRYTQVPKSDTENDSADPPETGKELQGKQNPGMIAGMMQKVNPFKSSQPKDTRPLHSDLSSSSGSLAENTDLPEKQIPDKECQTDSAVPNTASSFNTQENKTIHSEQSTSSGSFDDSTTERHEAVEVQTLELAEVPVPSEGTVLDPLDDEEGLLAWWRTVEGWDEWNEANQHDEAEEVVEQVADRVFMAARLFVRFFNQRGASLQQRILELLDLADSADIFHKKTVTASVSGGVASVAGSITTITGLILAPFTAGTSLIVTAVGIGVATAGGVASASANITDTVHSKTDRKKVEKMIQDYQEEMNDIKECLEFLQEGMETLEEWNFEQYAESISQKHLNQNVKHVMKEGGRAGKALMINTESLVSTVQVLGVAGGAAKATQVMSVTTGVMSGLFLALDVFFLAKDSMELKKGAKTEFANKIREVCKDLQDGLLELNRIKEQLQKTMDGIEVEVEEDEELLKFDLKKLIELEE
ncbi:uncharacterized protein si:cabz01007802.1 isoform X2 [Siniperca chuatsi]|uniref:uncharacterized protein si:cabz01007802.1 isoform X2 n=1 Tax=Siniperca chuatsi TaxID=119488 RepID=UPI001CE0F51C|nr:uncharacterized protein si:cabz01007802.1 isoform X2 [Siniperca chuatsi]